MGDVSSRAAAEDGGRVVRDAVESDAVACAAIYAPDVTGTTVSFETEPPSPDEMARRITTAARGFEPVGTYRAIGWKHGAWRDVTLVQRVIAPDGVLGDGPPAEPR